MDVAEHREWLVKQRDHAQRQVDDTTLSQANAKPYWRGVRDAHVTAIVHLDEP